jgi:hypothetical protein
MSNERQDDQSPAEQPPEESPCFRKERPATPPPGPHRRVHTRFMSESDVDGFSSEEPRLEIFCALDGCKFGLESHELCSYFERYVYDDEGQVIGIRCVRPDEDPDYPLAGTDDA